MSQEFDEEGINVTIVLFRDIIIAGSAGWRRREVATGNGWRSCCYRSPGDIRGGERKLFVYARMGHACTTKIRLRIRIDAREHNRAWSGGKGGREKRGSCDTCELPVCVGDGRDENDLRSSIDEKVGRRCAAGFISLFDSSTETSETYTV